MKKYVFVAVGEILLVGIMLVITPKGEKKDTTERVQKWSQYIFEGIIGGRVEMCGNIQTIIRDCEYTDENGNRAKIDVVTPGTFSGTVKSGDKIYFIREHVNSNRQFTSKNVESSAVGIFYSTVKPNLPNSTKLISFR